MKLNLWDRVLQLFGVKVTEEWILIGCMLGRHSWSVERRKCRNGAPIGNGGFIWMIRFADEASAREALATCTLKADEINRKNGYTL